MSPPLPIPIVQQINEALFRGEKIEAVKIYRTEAGCGLAEARSAVNRMEADLRTSVPEKFKIPPASSAPQLVGCTLFAAMMLVGALGVGMLWASHQGDAESESRYSKAFGPALLVVVTLQLCVQALNPKRKVLTYVSLGVLIFLLSAMVHKALKG